MTLSELINRIGDERCNFHWMADCVTSVTFNAKTRLATVTFKTSQPPAPDLNGFRDIGMVIWLPRKEAEALLQEAKEAKEATNAD